jgi:DNA processing protein
MKKLEIKEISCKENDFPESLKNIIPPPQKLYYRGSLSSIKKPCITIVGTRRATPYGLEIANLISRDLTEAGITIVSGLALGIDGAAHQGALKAKGKTVAVLGSGLNELYPKEHKKLAMDILSSEGALISEYEPETKPAPNQFLERNRIVSGLSLAVVVVEAPLRSGAISTAHHALEQGREVFIVPGPIHNSNYFGSHKLIRDGARLVSSARDIINDLNL